MATIGSEERTNLNVLGCCSLVNALLRHTAIVRGPGDYRPILRGGCLGSLKLETTTKIV